MAVPNWRVNYQYSVDSVRGRRERWRASSLTALSIWRIYDAARALYTRTHSQLGIDGRANSRGGRRRRRRLLVGTRGRLTHLARGSGALMQPDVPCKTSCDSLAASYSTVAFSYYRVVNILRCRGAAGNLLRTRRRRRRRRLLSRGTRE